MGRLPLSDKKQAPKKKVKDYPIDYLHIDFAEVHTPQGKSYLFVAVDCISKVAFADLHPRATKLIAADFLRRILAYFSHKTHEVLTGNGIQFGKQNQLFLLVIQPRLSWDYTPSLITSSLFRKP